MTNIRSGLRKDRCFFDRLTAILSFGLLLFACSPKDRSDFTCANTKDSLFCSIDALNSFQTAVRESSMARTLHFYPRYPKDLPEGTDYIYEHISRRVFFNQSRSGLLIFEVSKGFGAKEDTLTIVSLHKALLRDSSQPRVGYVGMHIPLIHHTSRLPMDDMLNYVDSALPSWLHNRLGIHMQGCFIVDSIFDALPYQLYSR